VINPIGFKKYVILDDLIDSGATLHYVVAQIKKCKRYVECEAIYVYRQRTLSPGRREAETVYRVIVRNAELYEDEEFDEHAT
jgi:hypoxanthine phosphoribosyltransferase